MTFNNGDKVTYLDCRGADVPAIFLRTDESDVNYSYVKVGNREELVHSVLVSPRTPDWRP